MRAGTHSYGPYLEVAQKTFDMAIQTPVLMKLDPILGYICISDHNLILNSY